MARLLALFALLPALELALWIEIQETDSPQPTFRVESRLVVIDLLVVDRGGNFVAGLEASDFEVLENGRPQPITFFHANRAPEPTPSSEPENRTLPLDDLDLNPLSESSFQPSSGARIIILIDLESIEPGDLARTKRKIADFIAQARPSDRFMLATVSKGFRVRLPFSNDLTHFLEALDRVRPIATFRHGVAEFVDELERSVAPLALDADSFRREAISLARQYLYEETRRVQLIADALSRFVEYLGSLPGRKNVVFFSSGYSNRIGYSMQTVVGQQVVGFEIGEPTQGTTVIGSQLGTLGSTSEMTADFRRAIEHANRYQVSFYSVDSRGLTSPVDAALRTPLSAQMVSDTIQDPQAFLSGLSSGTGGRLFINSNDLGRGIRRAYQDSLENYVLGYAPDTTLRPSRFRKIRIKLSRPGLKVIHRLGYAEPKDPQPDPRSVANALKFPGAFQDFPINIQARLENGEVEAQVHVPLRVLRFAGSGVRQRASVEVVLLLLDQKGEVVGGTPLISKTYHIDVNSQGRQELQQADRLISVYRGSLTPDQYVFQAVVKVAGRIATARKVVGSAEQ